MVLLSDILDQDHAIGWLGGAWRAGRLPHGLIFAGPAGVGKATSALAMAILFLCHHPHALSPCGQCDSCRMFRDDAASAHPDLHRIYKELIRFHDKTGKSKGTVLSIDVIREELLAPAARTPMLGHGKVFLIEEAELMSNDAQHALLKTLEEPAGRSLLILLTDQPDSLLSTIRSRAQLVRFNLVSEPQTQQILARKGLSPQRAAAAAACAQGSPGMALAWEQIGVVAKIEQLSQIVKDFLQTSTLADLPGWFKAAAEDYASHALRRDPLASKDQATRAALGIYLAAMARRLAQVLRRQSDPQRIARLCDMIERIGQTETYLDANVATALALRNLHVGLTVAG